jgi:hypothetical protein
MRNAAALMFPTRAVTARPAPLSMGTLNYLVGVIPDSVRHSHNLLLPIVLALSSKNYASFKMDLRACYLCFHERCRCADRGACTGFDRRSSCGGQERRRGRDDTPDFYGLVTAICVAPLNAPPRPDAPAPRMNPNRKSGYLEPKKAFADTMRYAHFAPHHATRHIVEAQRLEAEEFTGQKQAKAEANGSEQIVSTVVSALSSMPGTGVEPVRPLRGSGF